MRNLTISSTTTNLTANSEDVRLYLADIAKYKLLSKEREAELFKASKSKDEDVARVSRETIINANLRFVFSVAKQYGNSTNHFMDLVQNGNLGLCLAFDTYNVDSDVKFISYAVSNIRKYILIYLKQNVDNIRLPFNIASTLQSIKQIRSKFIAMNGFEPNVYEIADLGGLALDDVEKALSASSTKNITSFDKPLDDDSETSLEGILDVPNGFSDTDKALDKESTKIDLERALKTLSKRSQNVVCAMFGIGCQIKSKDEIAVELGLTAERVRQICAEALALLKDCKVLQKYAK